MEPIVLISIIIGIIAAEVIFFSILIDSNYDDADDVGVVFLVKMASICCFFS